MKMTIAQKLLVWIGENNGRFHWNKVDPVEVLERGICKDRKALSKALSSLIKSGYLDYGFDPETMKTVYKLSRFGTWAYTLHYQRTHNISTKKVRIDMFNAAVDMFKNIFQI